MKHIGNFDSFLNEATYGKNGNRVELDADALLDILKTDVRTRISKPEVINLLSKPAQFVTAVNYVTSDKKEGWLILHTFKRLARKEIEHDEIMANSFETLINMYFDKFGTGDEDPEFAAWLKEIADITAPAAKREILHDSIADTEKRIKALQVSLEEMKNELKELDTK